MEVFGDPLQWKHLKEEEESLFWLEYSLTVNEYGVTNYTVFCLS
jgi:hypothetical protein